MQRLSLAEQLREHFAEVTAGTMQILPEPEPVSESVPPQDIDTFIKNAIDWYATNRPVRLDLLPRTIVGLSDGPDISALTRSCSIPRPRSPVKKPDGRQAVQFRHKPSVRRFVNMSTRDGHGR